MQSTGAKGDGMSYHYWQIAAGLLLICGGAFAIDLSSVIEGGGGIAVRLFGWLLVGMGYVAVQVSVIAAGVHAGTERVHKALGEIEDAVSILDPEQPA
jgi:hypothetical protein